LLRSQIGAKTEVGLMAKTFMVKGSLVPDDVMSALIINELALLKQHSWLLDGK
jgi:adenylate kinase family enzyme